MLKMGSKLNLPTSKKDKDLNIVTSRASSARPDYLGKDDMKPLYEKTGF